MSDLSIFQDEFVVVASGPLTSDALSGAIMEATGEEYLHFFDAAAPIVSAESIDMGYAFFASRYDRGSDYVNCPMTKDEYEVFYHELLCAECAELHEFENTCVFEGCMPVETMAARGHDTLLFGPLKPKGLIDPKTGREPFAVVQLRKENEAGSMYNIVGFQTHLKFPEQKKVFGLIPALKNAEFLRYGVMHRNTFLNAPQLLDRYYRLRKNPAIRFAGSFCRISRVIYSEKAFLSTASAPPAATRVASAACMIRLPKRRISSFKRPAALQMRSDLKELLHTSSANSPLTCAGVFLPGFIS